MLIKELDENYIRPDYTATFRERSGSSKTFFVHLIVLAFLVGWC